MRFSLTVVLAALIMLPFADAADFKLRPVANDKKTITFSWKRQPGADGYQFTRNGVVVSRTFNRSTTRATFWKGSRYGVQVLDRRPDGKLRIAKRATFVSVRPRPAAKQAPKLVFVAAKKPAFRLRLVTQTPTKVTFAWKRQPGIDGYQFVRNGVVISRTFNRATTTATFWKGSRYAVDLLRVTSGKQVKPLRRALAVPLRARGSQRFVFLSAPVREFKLRVLKETPNTITFGWKRQPGVDGFQFVRNGVVISRTFNHATTTATFWKGSHYAVEILRVSQDKKVTRVYRALAYTNASAGSAKKTAPSGGKASAPGAGGGGSGSSGAPSAPSSPPASPPKSSSPPPPPSAPAAPKPTPPAPPSPPAPTIPSAPPAVGPGGTVMLSGSYSPDAFFAAIAVAPPGPVTVRGSYTITGSIEVSRPSLRIEGASVEGTVEFRAPASGSAFVNGSAVSFFLFGADDIVIEGNTFDGKGRSSGSKLWDAPAGNTPDGWTIRNNAFKNQYMTDGSHTQGIYVGYSSNGLIEGNTFTNNGNTGHIFFTWFGNTASPSTSYPRNICVRGNSFGPTHTAYVDIDLRNEIPLSANIKIQSDANIDRKEFYGSC